MTARALPTISPECLTVINDQVTTTSIDVARIFGKRHDHVLRTIESIEIPGEFTHPNFGVSDAHLINKVSDEQLKKEEAKIPPFAKCEYKDSTGRVLPAYRMTRDGFTFLVMGFTGKRATLFKWAYIAAFNAMEAELFQQKIWIGGLTQALEHICPTPPTEADNIRNQRAMKTLRALAAYWAILEEMPLAAAETAACVVGRIRRLDELDLAQHQFGDIRDFLERAIIHSDKDIRPATEEQINAIKFLVEACAQFRYSRDRNIYDLLQEEYEISIESIVNATRGEAKRIAALAYNLLHQHLMQTMTINEIKRRAQEADGKLTEPEDKPPQVDDGPGEGEEQP